MRNTLYILLLFSVFGSCKKAVDVAPVSVITSSSFWKSQNDAEGAINGLYVRFRSITDENLYMLGEARSEILSTALAGTVGLDKYYNQTLTVSNAGPSWLGIYQAVNQANLIIKYVPEIPFTAESAKNKILAEAYTMRAYLYFVMVKTWGGVPIRLEPTEGYDPLSIQVPRSTVEQVFDLVKSDINKALDLFPDNNYPNGRVRWSKPSAYALKGEVYLWTAKVLNGGNADFTTALNALNEIRGTNVELLDNYSSVFDYTNKGNKEVLFASRYIILESSNNYFQYMYLNASNLPSDITAETRAEIGAIGDGNAGNSIMQVSALVRNQFDAEDSRKSGTFYEIFSRGGSFITSITSKGKGFVDAGTRHFKNDIIIFRYADVLLMIAEAKNALGQDPSDEINELRQRAFGDNYAGHAFVNGSKEANDELILKERLFELCSEGKRWWDLIRFDKAFELVPNLQGKEGQRYLLLFPIGNAIRSLEPLVEENQGWQ